MVTEESLPILKDNSYLNPTLSPLERPNKPKSTSAIADKRNKNSKPSGNRAKAFGNRAQTEASAEGGQSMTSNEQSSDHDPQVATSIDLSESSNRLDDSKHRAHIANDFRVLILNRIRNHKRTFPVFQERSGHQGSLDRACGQRL
jgi:hypothetical protein